MLANSQQSIQIVQNANHDWDLYKIKKEAGKPLSNRLTISIRIVSLKQQPSQMYVLENGSGPSLSKLGL
tara:strand:+ start:29960 stop:30166 length:207 start_codon:yes stop_codon:yes gene_type:complete